MIRKLNHCVDCPTCVGGFCPEVDTPVVCCDCCEECADVFYILDGESLCRDCFIDAALDKAEKITATEIMANY